MSLWGVLEYDIGFQNEICDLLGGVLECVAQPTIRYVHVPYNIRARVQLYPGTRLIVLNNVRA